MQAAHVEWTDEHKHLSQMLNCIIRRPLARRRVRIHGQSASTATFAAELLPAAVESLQLPLLPNSQMVLW